MIILLPLFVLFFLIYFYYNRFPSLGFRVASILGAVSLIAASVIVVELLSFCGCLNKVAVRFFWVLMSIVALALLKLTKRQASFKWPQLSFFEIVVLLGILLILMLNAWVAYFFPPNNWDSMTYHLPRVMHWAAQGNLNFYPTDISRQLNYPPGAEFLLLHCFFLTGDDRWFNFLQLFSFIGCLLAVSKIAQILGASRQGQIITILFVVSLPIALLESTSTQNDLFISFLISACVVFILLLSKEFSRGLILLASAALGLGLLSKGTIVVLLPFLVYLFVRLRAQFGVTILICVVTVFVIAGGHFSRSWVSQGGHVMASSEQSGLIMQAHGVVPILVNTVAHLSTELMLPWQNFNQFLVKCTYKWMHFLGVNDHGLQIFGQHFIETKTYSIFDEDYAANPLHVVLIIMTLTLLWRIKPTKLLWLYLLCLGFSLMIFVSIIKWQPFITRLHLPLFMLFAPVVGLFWEKLEWWLFKALSVILLTIATSVIIFHATRSINLSFNGANWPRSAYYFIKKPFYFNSYQVVSEHIVSSGCHDVGLMEGADSWEYPLWAMTGYGKDVHFRKFDMVNSESPLPCLIVTLDTPLDKRLTLSNHTFMRVFSTPPLQAYL